jgi:hypothetical protein
MGATTRQTGDRAANPSDPAKTTPAIWATVKITASALTNGERQTVATFLITDAKIVAGAAPSVAVRRNSFSSGAKLGQQVGQLVEKRSMDFFGAMFEQKRVQRNQLCFVIGAAGACF